MFKAKLGIVGAGYIAEKHLEVLSSLKNVLIINIFSRTKKKSIALSKKYKIEYVSDNFNNFISDVRLDGILVLVSAEQIFKIVKKLLTYKIPLFVEKPIGLNFEETKKLIDINKIYNTKIMVGYNRRFYSIFDKGLKEIYKRGKLLGVSIEGHERFWKINNIITSKERKNWIFSNSIHTIDLLRFFGGEIKKMYSLKKKLYEKNGDQFNSIFEFSSGVIGNYVSHWYSPGGWSVKLYGEGITIIFNPLEEGFILDSNFRAHKINPIKEDKKFKAGFYNQMKCYINMIIKDKLEWPGQSLEDSFKTTKIAKKLLN